MIRHQRATLAILATAAAAVLAGCGGGDGSSADSADAPPPVDTSIAPAAGAGPTESASQAIAALGQPGGVDGDEVAGTLAGYDRFGLPRDAFEQLVREEAAATPPPPAAAPVAQPVPADGDALLGSGGGSATAPAGPTPVGPAPPAAEIVPLEADFDVSGEPVVAREGDAIPPDSQQFEVDEISPTTVTLKLVGGLLPDGTDTITLDEGEAITLYNATARKNYTIKLVDIRRI